MAGHSKWANIKHRKARQDAKRAKVWTKVIREVTVAARIGSGNVEDNPRLRAAVDNALSVNMPRDTIDRAVKRGAGGEDGAEVEELTYEGYGPSGVAILVEAMTDNRNRTVAEVRHAFTKYGGNLGTDGSVAYLFSKQGLLSFSADNNEETILEIALEAGAEDVDSDESGITTVFTSFESFGNVLDAFRGMDITPEYAEVTMIPSTTCVCDVDSAEKVLHLIDALEDLDDVQNVYSNGDLPESVLQG